MDVYFEMAKHPVFSVEDVNQFYPKLVGELSTKIRTKACFRGNRISGRKGFNNRTENLYPDQ